jgi:mRNA-degrading endonuclease RelE of RelBE toxin-antitoxin system
MKIQTTRPFDKDYQDLPDTIKDQADKQLTLFLDNPRHPSLNIKKVKGHTRIWEGRINKNYRFTFQFEGELCILRRIGTHNILKTP